jgi:hypothetical protein
VADTSGEGGACAATAAAGWGAQDCRDGRKGIGCVILPVLWTGVLLGSILIQRTAERWGQRRLRLGQLAGLRTRMLL